MSLLPREARSRNRNIFSFLDSVWKVQLAKYLTKR